MHQGSQHLGDFNFPANEGGSVQNSPAAWFSVKSFRQIHRGFGPFSCSLSASYEIHPRPSSVFLGFGGRSGFGGYGSGPCAPGEHATVCYKYASFHETRYSERFEKIRGSGRGGRKGRGGYDTMLRYHSSSEHSTACTKYIFSAFSCCTSTTDIIFVRCLRTMATERTPQRGAVH